MNPASIKNQLLDICKETVEKRYQKVRQTIKDIEESLEEESRSTSGDKHETGRAMLQIDRENAGKQLKEIETVLDLLKKIDVKSTSDYARLGSLVYTNRATFYISISIGAVTINTTPYLCVALNAPIGNQLAGKKKGDRFTFNDMEYMITSIR